MEEVPTEVLVKILSWLPEVELRKMEKLNERMRMVINEAIGFANAMGDLSKFSTSPKLAWDWPEKVIQRGVSKCWIGNLTEHVFEPQFRLPHILKKIYFEGRISQINFQSLLVPLTGLQHLTLHLSALASEGVTIGPEFFSSCILKSLSLTCKNCKLALEWSDPGSGRLSPAAAADANLARFTKNFKNLMVNLKSPRLIELILSFPMSESSEMEAATLIIGCVSRHGSTLKNLQVYWERAYDPSGARSTEVYNQALSSQEIYWNDFTGIFLKRFSFAFCDRNQNVSYPLWLELIRRQENLQELFYLNRSFKNPFFLKPIGPGRLRKLNKTLIHLNACRRIEDDPNWNIEQNVLNLEFFQQYPDLTHLLFRGEVAMGPLEKPGIKNIRNLPKLISILSIRDIWMSKADASAILGLEQLKRLRLLNIGFTGDLGLPFQDFIHVLDEKRLEEFEFQDSVNLDSVTHHGEIFLTLLYEQFRRNNKFHVVLKGQDNGSDETKYYIKVEDMFAYGEEFEHLRANGICDIVFR